MTTFNELIRKWGKMIVVTAVLTMIATMIIVPRLPKKQSVSVDITIPVPSRSATDNYEYDGYYALQAADLFSGTIVGWFKSPDFVARIYKKANVPLVTKSIRSLEKVFLVKKVSGQFITVKFSVKDEQQANDIGKAISDNIKERVEQINTNGNRSLVFSVLVGKPLVVLDQRDGFVDAVLAGFAVLVLGFNAVIIIDALKRNN